VFSDPPVSPTVATLPPRDDINRRRCPRYPVAIPLDVVVLRFGIPASIPGRSVDISESGLAAVLAGEVTPGEAVGVEFRLPLVTEPVQAKALVRHYGPMRCGLQFTAMPPEQQGALHTWVTMAAEVTGAARSGPQLVRRSGLTAAIEPAPPTPMRVRKRLRRRHPRWMWPAAAVAILAAGLGVWRWHSGWNELESAPVETSTSSPQQEVTVPAAVMEQRVIHKVDPVYPPEAEKSKIQGTVILAAVIGPDGVVRNLHPVSGPDPLARAALDAVKWWRFLPYRVNGQPVPVDTTIEVEFRLTR
jgi:TonB family protein